MSVAVVSEPDPDATGEANWSHSAGRSSRRRTCPPVARLRPSRLPDDGLERGWIGSNRVKALVRPPLGLAF